MGSTARVVLKCSLQVRRKIGIRARPNSILSRASVLICGEESAREQISAIENSLCICSTLLEIFTASSFLSQSSQRSI